MADVEFLRRKPGIPAVRWDGSEDGIAVIRRWIRAWTGNEPLTARRWMAQDDGNDQLCGVTIHGPNGDISLRAGDFVTMEQDGVFTALPQAEATKLYEFADGYHIALESYRGEVGSKPADGPKPDAPEAVAPPKRSPLTFEFFTKKAKMVTAARWDGTELHAMRICGWIGDAGGDVGSPVTKYTADRVTDKVTSFQIKTPTGWAELRPGDYVVWGGGTDFYPVGADEAEKLYDRVDATGTPIPASGEPLQAFGLPVEDFLTGAPLRAPKAADECHQGLAVGEDFVTLGDVDHAVTEKSRAMADEQAAAWGEALRGYRDLVADLGPTLSGKVGIAPDVGHASLGDVMAERASDRAKGIFDRDAVFTYTQAHPHFDLMTQLASRTGSGRVIVDGTFETALAAIKAGYRVTRAGWGYGGSAFLFLVPGSRFAVNRKPLLGIYPEGTMIDYRSHIDMKTVDGSVGSWVASQDDLLATDWIVLED